MHRNAGKCRECRLFRGYPAPKCRKVQGNAGFSGGIRPEMQGNAEKCRLFRGVSGPKCREMQRNAGKCRLFRGYPALKSRNRAVRCLRGTTQLDSRPRFAETTGTRSPNTIALALLCLRGAFSGLAGYGIICGGGRYVRIGRFDGQYVGAQGTAKTPADRPSARYCPRRLRRGTVGHSGTTTTPSPRGWPSGRTGRMWP